jgi:hypothetical protein
VNLDIDKKYDLELGIGNWILDTGYWILDSRLSMLEPVGER